MTGLTFSGHGLLQRFSNQLGELGARAPIALARALNHTGAKAKTAVIRNLVVQTGLKRSTIVRAVKVHVPQRDVAIWRGDDDPPLIWEFGDASTPDILQGSTFLLVVQAPGYEAALRSEDPASTLTVDLAARTVTWAYTATESAALPQGPARYELERIIAGKTRTWVWGALRVMSGLLDG